MPFGTADTAHSEHPPSTEHTPSTEQTPGLDSTPGAEHLGGAQHAGDNHDADALAATEPAHPAARPQTPAGAAADAAPDADPAVAPPAGPASPVPVTRGGLLTVGDTVQLTDPKGRHHTIQLVAGKGFHTHRGELSHDDLIGGYEGSVVTSSGGTPYLAVRPLLSDFVLSMPRGATVVYPKDSAAIVGYADIYPGARVLEAGAGSGALSCALLRAVGSGGSVTSYERRPEFAAVARRNVERFFGGPVAHWRLRDGDLADADERDIDRVVLDMLAPWEVLSAVATALRPGGVVCGYVATTTQLSRLVEGLREHGGFTEPAPFETLLRGWHVEGLAVRPEHRMIGHTGFLVTSRRLAPGVVAPPRRRRPAKGTDDTAAGTGPAATAG